MGITPSVEGPAGSGVDRWSVAGMRPRPVRGPGPAVALKTYTSFLGPPQRVTLLVVPPEVSYAPLRAGADSSGDPVAAYSAHSTTRAGGGAGRSGCATSSPSTSTRPEPGAARYALATARRPRAGRTPSGSRRASVIGPSCVGGPAAQGLTNSAGLAEFAGCGVPGSADPFSRPRRGATTPPNGKFGAPLPALSAASADPLARPGTGPSLYAISSSLRAIARADRQDSRVANSEEHAGTTRSVRSSVAW